MSVHRKKEMETSQDSYKPPKTLIALFIILWLIIIAIPTIVLILYLKA